MSPTEVLGSPHLVLTDTGGDNGILLPMRSQITQLLDDCLRFDKALRLLVLIVKWETLLPIPVLPCRRVRELVDYDLKVGGTYSGVRDGVVHQCGGRYGVLIIADYWQACAAMRAQGSCGRCGSVIEALYRRRRFSSMCFLKEAESQGAVVGVGEVVGRGED